MSIANRITLGRLVLAIVLFALLSIMNVKGSSGGLWLISAGVLFVIVVATDALDGYYARKYQQESDFGRVADPAVDKVVVCGTLIFLTASDWAKWVLPPWMVVLIVSREFAISSLRGYVESRGISFGADWSGKLKMIVQSIAIPGIFTVEAARFYLGDTNVLTSVLRILTVGLVWLAIVLTAYSGLDYVRKATRLLRPSA